MLGLSPSASAFEGIITELLYEGDVENAERWYHDMTTAYRLEPSLKVQLSFLERFLADDDMTKSSKWLSVIPWTCLEQNLPRILSNLTIFEPRKRRGGRHSDFHRCKLLMERCKERQAPLPHSLILASIAVGFRDANVGTDELEDLANLIRKAGSLIKINQKVGTITTLTVWCI